MSTNVTDTTRKYRGFLVPDPTITISTDPADTALFSQANPRPGTPVAYRPTDMVLETSGEEQTSSELHVATIQGGMPGLQEAGFVWTNKTPYTAAAHSAAGGAWRGWDTPNAISQFEGQIGAPRDVSDMSCITLQDGSILMTCVDSTGLMMFKRNASTNTWSNAGISGTLGDTFPCMLQLPEGRIHLYAVHTVAAAYTGFSGQVRLWVSDDNGANWVPSTQQCLGPIPGISTIGPLDLSGPLPDSTAINGEITVRRMRVAYNEGQVMLLIAAVFHNDSLRVVLNQWVQYASSDLGHNFDYIEKTAVSGTDDVNAGGFHDIVAAKNGTFLVVYHSARDNGALADGGVYCKSFSSAYQLWSTVAAVTVRAVGTGVLTARGVSFEFEGASLAAAMDQTGVIWVSWLFYQPRSSFVTVSYDHGTTWVTNKGDYENAGVESSWYTEGTLVAGGVSSGYPRAYCSTFQWGRHVIIALTHKGSTGGEGLGADASRPCVFYLGGYSSITRPFDFDTRSDDSQMAYSVNWAALNRLTDSSNWARTAVGVPTTEALTGGYFRVATAALVTLTFQNVQFSSTAFAYAAAYYMMLFEWDTVAGESNVKIRMSNGATGFEMWVTQTTTDLVFKDIIAGTTLLTVARPSAPGQNQVYICIDRFNLKFRAGYRAGSTSEDRGTWANTITYALANSGVTAAGDRVLIHTAQNSTVDWNIAQWSSGNFGQDPQATFPATDTEKGSFKYWRSYSGYPLYVNGGVSVAAPDGPTWPKESELGIGDRWDITPRYDFAIGNTNPFVSPSPRKTWRSKSSISSQYITFKIDKGFSRFAYRTWGVGLFNCNFRHATVSTGLGGVYTLVGDLYLNDGLLSLNGTWVGNQVNGISAAPGLDGSFFPKAALVGSHWYNTDGTDASSEIIQSDEGSVHGDSRLSLKLANSWVGAARTTGEIWLKDGVLVIKGNYNADSIRITVVGENYMSEPYMEIGTIVIGDVELMAKQYARGRSISAASNYNLTTGRGGVRRGRKLGPQRKSVEFSWANENIIDSSQVGSREDYPDYVRLGQGIHDNFAPAATGYSLLGLVDQLGGAVTPVVYLPTLEINNPDTAAQTITHPQEMMLCRFMSDIRMETVSGDEWSQTAGKGETMRVATVTLEEEV